MIYSDDAKNFRCHIPLFCINVKCLSCPFPGKRQRQWLFAFHPGIPGPAGLKGAKGDYGIKGLKGEPGLKGARGDTGFSGKALCHRICGDVGTFGFGTVDHRPTKASLGCVFRADLQELNREISLPSRGKFRVSVVHPGRCAKRHASTQMH